MNVPRLLFCAVLALCATPALGKEWRVQGFQTDPNDVVTTPLIDAFRFHAEPAAAWYLDQLNGALVSYDRFTTFHEALTRATYAAFEYTYQQDGRQRTRIYYAMSGQDNPPTGLPPASRSMASYMVEDHTRVHAYISDQDQSAIVSTQLEGENSSRIHARDAELKALRTIERDIRRRAVTSGGSIHAFISQPMCDSCEHALHRFAEIYDVDVNVNHLEADMSAAYFQFRGIMHGFTKTLLVRIRRPDGPGPTPPPPTAGMCARIFAQ
jgi:hypothetical protein